MFVKNGHFCKFCKIEAHAIVKWIFVHPAFKNKKGDRQHWRCSERDKCNARSTTDVFNPTHVVHDGTLKHTHPPITPEIKAEAVDRIKRRAQVHPNEPPQQVITAELRNDHNEEVLAHLPEHQNLKKSVNRMQNRSRPNNPADLNILDIVEPYTTTIRGSSSCSTTPGQTMKNGYLFLQQKKICVYFAKVRWFLSNGTFKTAPDMFTQLFTVHGLYLKHVFPLVYALTTHKDEETYDLLYEEIKSLATQNGYTFRPETMMSDFELANMNAARAHVVGIRIKGCLFHLS